MIRLIGADRALQDEYLAQLNLAFPGWGNAAHFAWCYRRSDDPLPADLMVAIIGGVPVAGLAVVYRQAQLGDCPPRTIGVLSGAWTIPAQHRQGHFGRLLAEASIVAASRGACLLLAFVTGERGSVGELGKVSTRIIDAAVLTAPCGPGEGDPETIPADEAARLFAGRPVAVAAARIVYAAGGWQAQMLGRASGASAIRMGCDRVGVVSPEPGGTLLLDLVDQRPKAITAAVRALPLRLGPISLYSADPATIAHLHAHGFSAHPARVFVTALQPGPLADCDWAVAAGDRM